MLILYKILLIIIILVGLLISPKIAHNAEAKPEVKVIQIHSINNIEVQFYAYERVSEVFGPEHWEAFSLIIKKESNWIHTAQNPNSSAHGLAQFLSSTYEQYGGYTEDPYKQINMAILYISDRYNNPQLALDFHIDNGYY